MNWIKMSDKLPPLYKDVLFCSTPACKGAGFLASEAGYWDGKDKITVPMWNGTNRPICDFDYWCEIDYPEWKDV